MRAFRSAVLNQPEADPVTQRRGTVRLEDGSVVKRTCSNNRARAGSQHTHDDSRVSGTPVPGARCPYSKTSVGTRNARGAHTYVGANSQVKSIKLKSYRDKTSLEDCHHSEIKPSQTFEFTVGIMRTPSLNSSSHGHKAQKDFFVVPCLLQEEIQSISVPRGKRHRWRRSAL